MLDIPFVLAVKFYSSLQRLYSYIPLSTWTPKDIYTRLLSGQTGKQSISVGLNCLQVKTGDQRSPVVRLSSSIVKSVQSSTEGQRIPR